MSDERLSPDDLAYHHVVQEQIVATRGAVNLWMGHLRQKYRLADQDHIGADGVIVRAVPVASSDG